jgi:predicted transcriptional regulator
MRSANLMKRLSASIPDRVYEQLEKLASKDGRSISNLVSYLLEQSIDKRIELDAITEGEKAQDKNRLPG